MGKKGTDGRRTSGITPTQVMNELSQHGFKLLTEANPEARPSTAFRKKVHATQNKLRGQVEKGKDVATSRSGRSIRMVRERDRVEVLLPVDDHMTDNALKAIQNKTGVQLSQLQQLQHKKIF